MIAGPAPVTITQGSIMGIAMIMDRGLICPQIFCDICERRILDATEANIEYDMSLNKTELILFVHMECDMSGDKWEAKTGRRMGWRRLDDFLNQMRHPENIRVSDGAST